MASRHTGAKLNKRDVIAKLEETKGNIAAVARAFGVSRNVVYAYIENTPAAKITCEDAREAMIDNAESVLYSKVLAGDTTCLTFFLKTQGKRRGYTERHEVTGADGEAIKMDVTTLQQSAEELAEWRKEQTAKLLSGQTAMETPLISPITTE